MDLSDQSPPSKAKPGSLRDRIAAFENRAASSQNTVPAPAPRPKPSGLAWKPNTPRSPDSLKPSFEHAGSMSASDAKESINKAGGLKERMAALQGKGGFGVPPPPVPIPSPERSKWKSPTVASRPAEDQDDKAVKSPTAVTGLVNQSAELIIGELPKVKEGDDDMEDEQGEEEEERRRRAALAARMARLGGARVGTVPVFGKKPTVHEEVPPTEQSPVAQTREEESSDAPVPDRNGEQLSTSAMEIPLAIQDNLESIPESVSHGSRIPTSMPMPSIVRKAAPPRKKVAKAPMPAPEAPPEAADTTLESCHSDPMDGVTSAVIDETAQEDQRNVQDSGEIFEEATGIVTETLNPSEDGSGSVEKGYQEALIVSEADETTLMSGITSEPEEDDNAPSPLSHHRPLESPPIISPDADVGSDHLNASPVLPNSQEQPSEGKSVEDAPILFSSPLPTSDSHEESVGKAHESEELGSESSDYGNECPEGNEGHQEATFNNLEMLGTSDLAEVLDEYLGGAADDNSASSIRPKLDGEWSHHHESAAPHSGSQNTGVDGTEITSEHELDPLRTAPLQSHVSSDLSPEGS